MADQGAVIGGGVEILGRAAIALHGLQLGVAGIDRRAAEAEQLAKASAPCRASSRGFDFQAQIGRLAVGAADAELLHFEAAVVFDHRVEDVLHDVGIDQVALGLDDFLYMNFQDSSEIRTEPDYTFAHFAALMA